MREIDNYKWTRVGWDDPNRCQYGNCKNIAVEKSKYCLAHGGNHAARTAEKERMKNYRLAKFKDRATELSEGDNITSLRDEVALLRMLIEERINRCNDTSDLLLISGPLSDLILKVEKVVSSMHRLESKLGLHLDKTRIIQFAQVIIEIIGKYETNPEVLDAVGEDIFKALGNL
jgi:hypothetical protein